MTENKRFTIRSYNGIGCHIFDGSIVIAEVHRADIKQLCDLLNALHEENQRLTDKLNNTALELVDAVISQGKAVEISEMSYHEFIKYRAKNGKPMELQL